MISGPLRKMRTSLTDPVTYWFRVGDTEIKLNDFLGIRIEIEFLGSIFCIQCGRAITKTFQQGYCFPCMQHIQECHNCILFPERCSVELGTCPQNHWAHEQCNQEHDVYLANSSGLKVGITRSCHVPTRWIDQGAVAALPILRVSNRRQAGLVELIFKEVVHDKTNWRNMLKNHVPSVDLFSEYQRLLSAVSEPLQLLQNQYAPGIVSLLEHEAITVIHYPVLKFPDKINTLSFDQTPTISGILQGIKGQYVLLDTGVINIRKFGGYVVQFKPNKLLKSHQCTKHLYC